MPYPQVPVYVPKISFEQMPGLIVLHRKQPQVDSNLHLVLASEIRGHSPRVPADAASAELECTGGQYFAFFIHYFHLRLPE